MTDLAALALAIPMLVLMLWVAYTAFTQVFRKLDGEPFHRSVYDVFGYDDFHDVFTEDEQDDYL